MSAPAMAGPAIMANDPKLEPGSGQARNARVMRAAADALDQEERDEQLANLLEALADACDRVQRAGLISLSESLRWSPVVGSALTIARKINDEASLVEELAAETDGS